MKTRLSTILLVFTVLAYFPACTQWNKMMGKDTKDENNSASTAPPSGAPPANPPSKPPPGPFAVFTDAAGVLQDSDGGIVASGGNTIPIHFDLRNSTDAPEGIQWAHCHCENDHVTGHIKFTFDKNNTGRTIDLSAYKTITFFMRLDRRHLPADNNNVYFEDGAGKSVDIEIRDIPGVNIDTLAWQNLSIPVSMLTGLDLTKMRVMFGIHPLAADTTAVGPHVDLDGIVWKS